MDGIVFEQLEDLTEVKQAELDAWVAEQNAKLRKEAMQKFGKAPISDVRLPRIAKNEVTQLEYDARLYSLLHIIRNPELTDDKTPLATAWRQLYAHISYNKYATNWKISKHHREVIKDALKSAGMYKRFAIDSVAAVINRVSTHYNTQRRLEMEKENSELKKELRELRLLIEDSGDMVYRGVTIKKLSRTFKVEVGDFTLETRHGTFDKLDEFLRQVDKLLD